MDGYLYGSLWKGFSTIKLRCLGYYMKYEYMIEMEYL